MCLRRQHQWAAVLWSDARPALSSGDRMGGSPVGGCLGSGLFLLLFFPRALYLHVAEADQIASLGWQDFGFCSWIVFSLVLRGWTVFVDSTFWKLETNDNATDPLTHVSHTGPHTINYPHTPSTSPDASNSPNTSSNTRQQ